MLQMHRRLAWTFRGELTWFERKLYSSLSQESNKAMNLNSYIGLMGHSFDVRQTPEGQVLAPAGNSGSIVIPDADYLLTLDADSIILPEYCLRLVYVIAQPENAKLAVIQTPYSAFPGSPTRMERLSGATTDIQHIVHQGMSYYGATFWVGANAVIRKRALDDIVEIEHQGGFEIRRYVMDRTVIEDTESSIDLAVHGWWLLNYPERLSYSATPPDFGSLCIQRRRWANGGLIIMPKLWTLRHARLKRAEKGRAIETLLRLNYLASTCWSSIALVLLLWYPFNNKLLSPLVLLAALPYFTAMSSDLKHCGYKRMDIFRVYGFNLILLPVNLAGVVKSIQQAITGRRIPFARTPKVSNRTATPLLFAFSPFLIIGWSIFTVWRGIENQFWGNVAFAAFNTVTATLRAALTDGPAVRDRRHLAGLRRAALRLGHEGPGGAGASAAGGAGRRRHRRGRTSCTAVPRPQPPAITCRRAPACSGSWPMPRNRRRCTTAARPIEYGPPGYGRRATDRIDGPGQRAGDRAGGLGQRAGDRVEGNGQRAGDQVRSIRRAGGRPGRGAGRAGAGDIVNENDSIENVPIAAVPPPGGDGRHLSFFRIFLVVAVVAAMIGGDGVLPAQQGIRGNRRSPPVLVRALCRRHRHPEVRLRGSDGFEAPLGGARVRGQRAGEPMRAQLGWRLLDGGSRATRSNSTAGSPGCGNSAAT